MSYPDTLPDPLNLARGWTALEERKLIPEKWRPVVPHIDHDTLFRPLQDMLRRFGLFDHPRLAGFSDFNIGLIVSPYGHVPEWDVQACHDELWRRWDMHLIELRPLYDLSAWTLVATQWDDDRWEALK